MSEKNVKTQFNAYEYIGIIAPGSVLCLGIIMIWPEAKEIFFNESFTVGELGLFLIISYVTGHLLQSVGNVIEKVLWYFCGGMPTNWVLQKNQKLISPQQRKKLEAKTNQDLESLSEKDWQPFVREIYIDVEKAARNNRIDSFNKSYGLLRGIASGFFVLAVVIPLHLPENWRVSLWLLGLGVFPAMVRMFRFGKLYGRELIIEYIKL
jgi:hypothetical protein